MAYAIFHTGLGFDTLWAAFNRTPEDGSFVIEDEDDAQIFVVPVFGDDLVCEDCGANDEVLYELDEERMCVEGIWWKELVRPYVLCRTHAREIL